MENNYFKIAFSPLEWHKHVTEVSYTVLENYATYDYTNFDYAFHHYNQDYSNLLRMNLSTDYHHITCIFNPDGYWEVKEFA